MRLLTSVVALFALTIAPDLGRRLAKWKPVDMPYDSSGLDAHQKQVVQKLVDASRCMEAIYWQQGDPEALEIAKTTKNAELRRFLIINGGRLGSDRRQQAFPGYRADAARAQFVSKAFDAR